MGLTVVAFHAHPDDEALSGGTLARAAAEGHRVVVVTATRGEAGLAGVEDGHGERLAARRMAELRAAGAALGCAAVSWLGYRDSGLDGAPPADAFARADVEAAARNLAILLRREATDLLITHDVNGGYGHPDHRQAHRVAMRAAALAGTPRTVQVTLPGDLLRLGQGALTVLRHPLGATPEGTAGRFVRRRDITHVVRVDGVALDAKRRAMAAHASQRRSTDGRSRVLDRLLTLPEPLARVVLGREWFVDVGAPAGGRRRDLFPLERPAS